MLILNEGGVAWRHRCKKKEAAEEEKEDAVGRAISPPDSAKSVARAPGISRRQANPRLDSLAREALLSHATP